MRRSALGLALAAALTAPAIALAAPSLVAPSLVDDVDPFIGTGADGHTYPGAVVPFGMVQLSPDTLIADFKHSYAHAAGYRYEDRSIQGFSHTHFSGAGHSDLGDVSLMPVAGAEVPLEPGDPAQPGSGYRSAFDHASERASPGYYAVTLKRFGVRAELTAGERIGVHRYSFPADEDAHLLLDLRHVIYDYPGKVLWSSLRVRPDGAVTGMRETRGWAPGRRLYFALRFSAAPTGHALYDREPVEAPYHGFSPPGDGPRGLPYLQGRGLVGVWDFGRLTRPLVVTVALSPVSEDGALANLAAEAPGFDFDAVRARARAAWARELDRVEIAAPAPMRRSLATALYHALLAPSLSMDADGRYVGPDNAVHQAQGFRFVSSFSLWDTYRAEEPLMTLIQPDARSADVMRSLLASRDESPWGILPVWQFAGLETWCMIGYHAVPELADAVMKGLPGFDANRALDAMVASADYRPYGHLGLYIDHGYVPVDGDGEAVSETLEYAFDDWTIAQAARKLGRADVAGRFDRRAANWRNVFDPATGWAQPRLASGAWREPFDPAQAGEGSGFTEGNSWQYTEYAPQDVGGLIRGLGGDDRLVAKLDTTFDQHVDPKSYAHVEDMAGLIGQYVHGNEPSHHMAYLYSYAGQPWRTEARLKQIVDSQYRPAPDGLVGNDDLGQMSAWLVFTALGFYPVAPASNQYVIGRPFVERASLALPNGRRFTVEAQGLSDAHPYVQAVTLDGRPLARAYITHEEILRGGTLRFTMGAKPALGRAYPAAARPYSMTPYPASTAPAPAG